MAPRSGAGNGRVQSRQVVGGRLGPERQYGQLRRVRNATAAWRGVARKQRVAGTRGSGKTEGEPGVVGQVVV